jgi:soluble lytic murein transglycosylase-like protein
MTRDQLQPFAIAAAKAHGIDPALVCAVCNHESGWHQWAVRYEPAFYEKYIAKMAGLSQTEMTMRATSFGLMQIMGQVAREQGFSGDYLSELLDPLQNCERGCIKLAQCLDRANGIVTTALSLYNGGANKEYPSLVMRYYPFYKGIGQQ